MTWAKPCAPEKLRPGGKSDQRGAFGAYGLGQHGGLRATRGLANAPHDARTPLPADSGRDRKHLDPSGNARPNAFAPLLRDLRRAVEPVLVVQPAQDQTRRHLAARGQAMAMLLQGAGESRYRVRQARTQAGMGPAVVGGRNPLWQCRIRSRSRSR